MSIETITGAQFNAMLGNFKPSTRKDDKFYPRPLRKGEWHRQQCEDFCEILKLQELPAVNHELMAINSLVGRAIKLAFAPLHRHAEFIAKVPSLVYTPKDLLKKMEQEYSHLRDDRSAALNAIDPVRKRAIALLQNVKAFPEDWGREEYLGTIGGLLDDLFTLQGDVFAIGQPVLFNPYSTSAKSAWHSYYDMWEKLTIEERAQRLDSHRESAAECHRLLAHYKDLMGEYAKSNVILQRLNADLKAARKEAVVEYNDLVQYGDYPLRARTPELTGDYYADAQLGENGCYTLTIPASLAVSLNLTPDARIKMGLTGDSLIVKNLDADKPPYFAPAAVETNPDQPVTAAPPAGKIRRLFSYIFRRAKQTS
ncbi:hypothetical protein NMD10_27655 (plasmid) [Citrobacter portucalensis]|uniref:hypothetical protein n=1 Tax=Citrobacter portucalensis TaxID=1639133 RepID=UPI00351D2151